MGVGALPLRGLSCTFAVTATHADLPNVRLRESCRSVQFQLDGASRALSDVAIQPVRSLQLPSAAAVLARGMRDNPVHVPVFGGPPARREHALRELFTEVLHQYQTKGIILGAFEDGQLLGVCAMVEPGQCQPSAVAKIRLFSVLVRGAGLGAAIRAARWAAGWARHDPPTAHWHLGPVAVDRDRQGTGIGTAMMAEFCARMDAVGMEAYLETDKERNVRFYERFDFEVTAQQDILGVPNWFMTRSVVGAT